MNGTDERFRTRTFYSCCLSDGAPLVCTLERPGKEWHCLRCGEWVEFLHVANVAASPTLAAEYESLLARFRSGERGPIDKANPA